MAGDTDDRITSRIRETTDVLALYIEYADPGITADICRSGLPVISGICRGLDPTGKPGIDHEPGCEGDVGFKMGKPFTDIPDIARPHGIYPDKWFSPDGAIHLPLFKTGIHRDQSGGSLVLQDVKVRPESGNLDMVGSLLQVTPENMNDRALGAGRILDLDDVQGNIPSEMFGPFCHGSSGGGIAVRTHEII
ncbi:MAG: hypothetical protein BWY93_02299 [Euryarchaeota archaeon ADurb.BinA087]|nr:MAG: hypothetical protein BWY93_02299 [Euryarchaeota archaeon ADurb.BinA087]